MSERLNALVRVRALQERVARGAVARARVKVDRATEAERQLWAHLDDVSDQMAGLHVGGHFLAAHHHIQAGLSLAKLRRVAKEQGQAQLHEEANSWSRAAQRLEAAERLSEREEERVAESLHQRELHELDELAISRHRPEEQVQ